MVDRDGRVLNEHAGSRLFLGAGGAVRVNVASKGPTTAPRTWSVGDDFVPTSI